MKKLSFIIAAGFFFVLFSGFCCYAQQKQHSTAYWIAVGAQIDSSIAMLHLDTLHGKILGLYSNGYKVRAEAIQSMVEKCAAFYKPKFPHIKFDLQIMILDREDWHRIHLDEYHHYGSLNAWPGINKMFITADREAVGKHYGGNNNLPDSILLKFDDVACHELGHIFLQKYNNIHIPKRWANEFLASYFAICFFQQQNDYPGLPQMDESAYQPKYKTLADFERLYNKVGSQNYAWYQGKFQELGKRLYPKFKVELLRKFIANYAPDGKKLDPLDLLKQLAPKITNQWQKEMK